MLSTLLLDIETEVEATANNADEGKAEATLLKVVDRGEDELSEAQTKSEYRDNRMTIALKATAIASFAHILLLQKFEFHFS